VLSPSKRPAFSDMRRPVVAAAAVLALTLALAGTACSPSKVETTDVAGPVPWADHEEAHYQLVGGDGEEQGMGVLSIQREGDAFRLDLDYSDNSNSDQTQVVVAADTLKPQSLHREILNEGETEVVEAEYGPEEVTIRSGGRQSFLRLPDHYYDNDSALFIWRTLPFADGLVVHYNTVVTNRRRTAVVTLKVVGHEEVEVPAGSFDAWRLEIRSGSIRQVAWYADNERRYLVKYDNSQQVFLLEETPSEQ
jgi:hypothetical protein